MVRRTGILQDPWKGLKGRYSSVGLRVRVRVLVLGLGLREKSVTMGYFLCITLYIPSE